MCVLLPGCWRSKTGEASLYCRSFQPHPPLRRKRTAVRHCRHRQSLRTYQQTAQCLHLTTLQVSWNIFGYDASWHTQNYHICAPHPQAVWFVRCILLRRIPLSLCALYLALFLQSCVKVADFCCVQTQRMLGLPPARVASESRLYCRKRPLPR